MNENNGTDKEILYSDVRSLLANERTLLAWVRTALAVIAGGLLITQIGEKSHQQIIFGIFTIILGASMALIGYYRFMKVNQAIRSSQLPKIGRGPVLQIACVAVFVLAIVILELTRLK